MRRLFRHSGIILCLFAATMVVALWARSFMSGDRYRWVTVQQNGATTSWRSTTLFSSGGGLSLNRQSADTTDPAAGQQLVARAQGAKDRGRLGYGTFRAPRHPISSDRPDSLLTSLGFFWDHDRDVTQMMDERRFELTVPFWAILALTCAYPLISYARGVIHRQREDRLALGLCPRCGCAFTEQDLRCPGCDRPRAVITTSPTPGQS